MVNKNADEYFVKKVKHASATIILCELPSGAQRSGFYFMCDACNADWCQHLALFLTGGSDAEYIHALREDAIVHVPVVPTENVWARAILVGSALPRRVVCIEMLNNKFDPETAADQEPLGYLYESEGLMTIRRLLVDKIQAVMQSGLKCPQQYEVHGLEEERKLKAIRLNNQSETGKRAITAEAWRILALGHCGACNKWFDRQAGIVPSDMTNANPQYDGRKDPFSPSDHEMIPY